MGLYRVMLVDDEIWGLKGLERIVDWNSFGFEIAAECRSGQEALEKAEECLPDVIFTDLMMKNMGGKDLLRLLREKGNEAEVVFVSAYSDFDAAREGIRLGVFDYLLKPYRKSDIEELLRKLSDLLEMKNTGEKAEEKVVLIADKAGRFTDSEFAYLSKHLHGTCCYLGIMPENIDKERVIQRFEFLKQYSTGEFVECLVYDKSKRGIFFCTEEPLEELLPETDRMGNSFAYPDFTCYEDMVFEAVFSAETGIAFSSDPVCSKMQKYIVHGIDKNCSLEEVAECVHLSKSYASSLFSKNVGMSMTEFQKKAKMFVGCWLLAQVNKSISEVAAELGYDDASYFSRVFRCEMGMMPSEYRKRIADKNVTAQAAGNQSAELQ